MSTKSCYLYLLSENMVSPHCVVKFSLMYSLLDWPSTERSLTFFDLNRQVTDLCWKIAHGVLYTAQRLVSFGLSVPPSCFCGSPVKLLEHLFFYCPLLRGFSPGSSHCCSVFPSCVLLFFVDMFFSASALTSWLSPPGSLCTC